MREVVGPPRVAVAARRLGGREHARVPPSPRHTERMEWLLIAIAVAGVAASVMLQQRRPAARSPTRPRVLSPSPSAATASCSGTPPAPFPVRGRDLERTASCTRPGGRRRRPVVRGRHPDQAQPKLTKADADALIGRCCGPCAATPVGHPTDRGPTPAASDLVLSLTCSPAADCCSCPAGWRRSGWRRGGVRLAGRAARPAARAASAAGREPAGRVGRPDDRPADRCARGAACG